MDKTQTNYSASLKASEYDFLEVNENMAGSITIKLLEGRWRTKEETIALLQEVIEQIKTL